jgi:4-amino-4-deoxy-L-arabinose transferase-like glycosyltransferase
MTQLARRPAALVATLLGVLLLATSGRYGYHRDELYFLEAGHHLAWGYPDQPPLVPLIARATSAIAPHSLVLLRLPSTLAAVAVVLLAGAMARRLGAGWDGELLAAAATAVCGFTLGMGHLLSTATFDLLGWTLLTSLVLGLVQGADPRWWLATGLVAGVTLQANVLVGFLLAALGVALVLVGPRSVLRSPWPWVAAVVALVLVLPYLLWQADRGWPQLDVARAIADGDSGSSSSRPAFVPLLLLEVGPWLLPIWVWGLVRLWRDRDVRCFAVTFGLLFAVFLLTAGKPYYLAGLFPLLFAAGAQPLLDRARRWVAPALLVLSVPALFFTLPLLPVSAVDPVVAVNYDAGETIGWPQLVRQVAVAHAGLPAGTPILTSNYGQAGAIDRFGAELGLPPAYSGHNGYAAWGRPPAADPVLVVGGDRGLLDRVCAEKRSLGTLTSPSDVDNDENGTRLTYCLPVRSWAALWPQITHLG